MILKYVLFQVNGVVSKHSLAQLCIFLCNHFSCVRRKTANKLYDALLLYGDCNVIPAENLEEVMSIINETNWEQGLDIVKPIRNQICNLMGVPSPKTVKKAAA
jgi:hypothetical protein